MKKFLGIILAVMMLATVAFAADITVTLNGEAIDFADQPATIVEGRTLVPLRAIFEALGASVEWDQSTKTVTSAMDDVTVKLTIGDNNLYRNNEAVTLDVPAQIINSRTMVPARAIAEAYGVDVQWDAATRTVVLTKEEKSEFPADSFITYSAAYTAGAEELSLVEDPENPENMAFYIKSTAGEAIGWTYLLMPAKYMPATRYLVEFDAYLDADGMGNEVTDANADIGINFIYGDYNESDEGNPRHHGGTIDGRLSNVKLASKTWTHVTYIYEVPETLNEDAGMEFGIYSNPVYASGYADQLSTSYYIDNLSVTIYDGEAANGPHYDFVNDAAGNEDSEPAEKISLDINSVEGIVYDFEEDLGNLSPSNKHEIVGGCLVFDCTGDNDPRLEDGSVSFEADEYKGVMMKMKYENFVLTDARHPETFGVYFATDSDSELSQSKYADTMLRDYEPDEDGWYTVYVDMTKNPAWDGKILLIRFDPLNGEAIMTIDKIVIVKK